MAPFHRWGNWGSKKKRDTSQSIYVALGKGKIETGDPVGSPFPPNKSLSCWAQTAQVVVNGYLSLEAA